MTLEDKDKMVDEINYFCGNFDCGVCPLHDLCEKHGGFGDNTPDDAVAKAYKLIPRQPEMVNHPNHYQGANECIKVMEAMFGKEAVKHFCMCNAFKYRFRADKKNGDEDIRKAEWYETYLINMGGIDNDTK